MSPLIKYFARRVAASIPLIFGVLTIVFFLSRLLPGDATDRLIAPTIPDVVREQLRNQLGLDRPVLEQYVLWMKGVLNGDLGRSFTRNEPVLDIIASVLPNTIILGGAAFCLEMILGILLAVPLFLFHRRRMERIFSRVLVALYAIPPFWIGMLLLMTLSYRFNLFPSSQMYSSGEYGSITSLLEHLVLPALTAAIPGAAAFARYVRSSIISVMQQDYVLYAYSMGLSQRRIFWSYILPNAISPMITLAGIEFALLMSGVLVTETLFSWPGMGQLTVHAIFSRDYPLLLGCVLVAGVAVVGANLLADVANFMIDPRLRSAQCVL